MIQEFCFNPSASPFLPTTCLSLTNSRLNAVYSETSAMAAHLPYIQPCWSQAEFSQPAWSNVYQPEPRLTAQQYNSTTNYPAREMTAKSAGFEQQGGVPCPEDWYLDSTGNHQALQSLPSFQVRIHCVWWVGHLAAVCMLVDCAANCCLPAYCQY